MSQSRPGTAVERAAKRAMDLVVSGPLLLLLAPTMAALGAAVAATSPGGPFFNQLRAGRDGRPFAIYKLRTMTASDPSETVERYSYDRDAARVTRVGALLRRFSLDELPQLLNVFRGDMSLVGPRPDTVAHTEAYDEFKRRRLAVRPGITGWAQISGRNELTWDERIQLDVEYIENWSFALDMRILIRTAVVVLTGRGAGLPR
jgi:lipopolysaccharide/colanic/teichoic acid biosynthesis glycosyltransferase